MDITIIIPVYNESRKIASDISAASEFINKNSLQGEIIVVDDGSTDKTAETAKNIKTPVQVSLIVERYQHHSGKGYAIRAGMNKSRGEYVVFADSGNCVPYADIMRGMNLIKNGTCDIAHGSRRTKQSNIIKRQSSFRRICSRFFHWFVVFYMKIPRKLTDTQCGFKIYKGDVARHLYGECITNGFMFDIEIILRAIKEGYRICEFPIQWSCDRDSRLSPTRSIFNVLCELVKIKGVVNRIS